MGFDIECIIDLQSYPGEYFCPVCRTLVYPSEALQAQCTHVYCKPCLAHIANGTRACPYDGYLVTESDSKQLMESDKPLAEKIGKVKVHCLFFRSGCTWEGTLSDSASHGSVCSFGNSPVICNRCGVQIVHRQVHEHAQVCPGVYDGGLTRSGTTSSTVTVPQAQNPPLPVQNPNVQTSQPTAALTAPEQQWYQQQQYYQQYAGYDPYQQQQQQQYYQQQYQQQVPVQGQPQQPLQQQPHPVQQQPPQMQNYQQPLRPQVLPPPPPPPQAIGVRPPAQHQQMPQYQPHMQPQMHPQTQPYTQSSNAQIQPQSQPYHQSQSQPPMFHPQAQAASSGNLPQPPHPPVSGHQSYQQPPPTQNMQPGALQQHPVPQQPALMRPSQNHGSVSQQPSTLLPPQSKVPLAPNQQFLPHGQQPTYPVQFRPPMQPVQPSNYAQQQQSLAPFQGQMHQQGHLPPPQSMQSQMQMRASGPLQPQQSQNYVGMPMMPNQGIHSQSHSVSSGGFGPLAPSGPAQLPSTQTSINQNHAKPTILEQNATAQDIRSPSKRPAEKSFEGESVGQNETALKDANNAAKDGLVKSDINQEKGDMMGTLEQSFGGKSSEDEFRKEEAHSLTDSVPLKQGNLDNHLKLPKTAVAGQSSADYDRQSLSAGSTEGPQGPVVVPHHGQSHKLSEGKFQYGPYGPQFAEGYYGPQHVVRPNEGAMPRDRMLGSGEGGPLVKPHADESSFLRANGGPSPDSSMFGPRDENIKHLPREQLNFFPREPVRPLEQGSRSHGPMYDAGSKLDPGDMGSHSGFLPHRPSGGHGHQDVLRSGPEFGQHHNKPFSYQSPGGDYLSSPPRRFGGPSSFTHGSSSLDDFNSREPHRFGERSMPSNLPPDLVGNSFRDGRFPPLPGGHLRRGEIDGPMNPRFGEHMPPAQIHNQIGSEDVFWADGPGHLTRGKPSGPGYLPGHFNMGETGGPGTFSGHGYAGEVSGNFPRPPFSETAGGDMPGYPPFGDPAMRNNYPFHGFPNARNYSGGMDSIDQSRNRKLPSTGWCRVCEFDCDAVEGLEMHSQTREHQNMAMDMVKSIKLKIKKKHRVSAGRMSHEGGRSRKMGSAGRGKRH